MYMHVLCVLWLLGVVSPHGHIKSPAARSSMWRYGWDTKKNYDDNQLFCGGMAYQWEQMKGKCGICGDAYDANPRPNEWPGGEYATGIVTGQYTAGDVINVEMVITVQHGGYFEYRLCPLKSYMNEATQECLDRLLLKQPSGSTKFYVKREDGARSYTVPLRLPKHVTCERCVMQWRWNTGNSWGCMDDIGSKNKTCCLGCGQQEQFINCADIRITGSSGSTGSAKMRISTTPTRRRDDFVKQSWKTVGTLENFQTPKQPIRQQNNPVPRWRRPQMSELQVPFKPQQPLQFNRFSATERTQRVPFNQQSPSISYFNTRSNLGRSFVIGSPNFSSSKSLLVPRARPSGFAASFSRSSRWNPGESFVVSRVGSSQLGSLLQETARARCVARFPRFTTFSCSESCATKQQTCVAKSRSHDPDGACTWMCKLGD